MLSKVFKHFVMDRDIYCYRVMSFGLKNMRVIFQRMINKIFKHQTMRNVKVYVEDMIIKSRITDSHLTNLVNTFQVLKRFKICLNPSCVLSELAQNNFSYLLFTRGEYIQTPRRSMPY